MDSKMFFMTRKEIYRKESTPESLEILRTLTPKLAESCFCRQIVLKFEWPKFD